jgi:hypothetical protein
MVRPRVKRPGISSGAPSTTLLRALLDMSAVPRALLGETAASANDERDAILSAIDIILHGYPVGRPR